MHSKFDKRASVHGVGYNVREFVPVYSLIVKMHSVVDFAEEPYESLLNPYLVRSKQYTCFSYLYIGSLYVSC